VNNFKEYTQITYPLCIGASATRAAYSAYEANDVSMVIDQSGIIRYRGPGVQTVNIKPFIDDLIATSVEDDNSVIPKSPELYQNYPNPFNPVTNIAFEIRQAQKVTLQIYDNRGRLIKTMIENQLNAGHHEVSWNGVNNQGRPAASGVYMYVLKTEDFRSSKKMILVR